MKKIIRLQIFHPFKYKKNRKKIIESFFKNFFHLIELMILMLIHTHVKGVMNNIYVDSCDLIRFVDLGMSLFYLNIYEAIRVKCRACVQKFH